MLPRSDPTPAPASDIRENRRAIQIRPSQLKNQRLRLSCFSVPPIQLRLSLSQRVLIPLTHLFDIGFGRHLGPGEHLRSLPACQSFTADIGNMERGFDIAGQTVESE